MACCGPYLRARRIRRLTRLQAKRCRAIPKDINEAGAATLQAPRRHPSPLAMMQADSIAPDTEFVAYILRIARRLMRLRTWHSNDGALRCKRGSAMWRSIADQTDNT
jgi:hypothetical protein